MLFIAATSWCRHEPDAPSPSRHRYRLRVVRVNKKSMPDKAPGTGFFIATHHPECKSPAWSLRVLFFIPARPAGQAARGRAALLLSRSPAMLPIRPKGFP